MKQFVDYKQIYNSTIFTKIYHNNLWGGDKGKYYSGSGSYNPSINGYVNVVADLILKEKIKSIVEIGCGDFHVSSLILSDLERKNHTYNYTGYDVVKPLIKNNSAVFGSQKISFICKDSCVGKIKAGELLIVRQVLQHLNNKSIKQITEKFKDYKYIIVTEHQPSEKYGDGIEPNIDQLTGASIRLRFRSGVYVDKEPFNCRISDLLYTIPESVYGLEGCINTFLIKNLD